MARCGQAPSGGHRRDFCSDCLVERRAQPGATVLLQTQSGRILLALSAAANELFSVRDTFPLPTRPRSDGRSTCGSPRRGSRKTARACQSRRRLWYRPKLHTKNTRATPLSSEEAAAETAASVAAAHDRWQASETSRRRAVEASEKSAEALHKAQRESDEILDNLLKRRRGL